jgi:uncharacterized protein YcfJ
MAEQTLFGSYNPELIKQAIEAERESNLLAQAKLTPQQITLLGSARAGQQLGSALGGVVGSLFGNAPVQDPRLQQAQLGQQAYQEALQASGNDASSPAFFKQLSSSAAKLGVTTLAQQAAQQAAKLEAEESLTAGRKAQATEIEARTKKIEFAQQQEEKLRQELSTLPSNATEEQILAVYRRYGSADQQSRAIQASLDRRARSAEVSRMAQPEFNNNGVPMGRVDAKGNFFDNSGRKVASKEYVDAEQSHNTAVDLLSSLRQITDQDINNAFGSVADYTTSDTARLLGSNFAAKTQQAQYKINQVGVKTILENLQKLKGASTDKEMQKVASTFPGYQAKPEVMKAWIDDAIQTTNKFLQRSEKRYGFDTTYEQENRFGTKGAKKSSASEVPSISDDALINKYLQPKR